MNAFGKVASKYKSKKLTGNQQEKVGKVMHEFKTGKLKSSSGQLVHNRKQALAIALNR